MVRTKRRFAVNSKIWSGDFKSHFSEILEKVSEFGFQGVEIPLSAADIDKETLLRALEGNYGSRNRGRIVPIVTSSGTRTADTSSLDSGIRARGVERVKGCIQFCSNIGGSFVCGPLYAAVGNLAYLSEDERKAHMGAIADSFREISDYANVRRIRIALEPLCRYDTHLVNTVKQALELLDMISKDNVGLLLDTFHMNIEEKSLREAIVAAGENIYHFHACENDRGVPGTGLIRWDEVASALDEINYSNWVSIESFAPFEKEFSTPMRVWRPLAPTQNDIAKEGLRFLKRIF